MNGDSVSNKPTKKYRHVLIPLAVVIVLVLAWGLIPRYSAPSSPWIHSVRHLGYFADGIYHFAETHEARLPRSLWSLTPQFIDAETFPHLKYRAPDRKQFDWIYFARPSLEGLPPETILVAAPTPEAHAGPDLKRLILTADFKIVWLEEAEFQRQMASQSK